MKITLEAKKAQFDLECTTLNLKYEYSDYTGSERYAIITSLSECELLDKYADIIERYSPFLLLSKEQGSAIKDYQNNEAKHRMRGLLYGHAFDVNDPDFEEHHPECASFVDYAEMIDRQETIHKIREAISLLPEVQKDRIIKYFFQNKTYKEIGIEEGVDASSIRESIAWALKKIKNIFK